jgi:hypothetical protein
VSSKHSIPYPTAVHTLSVVIRDMICFLKHSVSLSISYSCTYFVVTLESFHTRNPAPLPAVCNIPWLALFQL